MRIKKSNSKRRETQVAALYLITHMAVKTVSLPNSILRMPCARSVVQYNRHPIKKSLNHRNNIVAIVAADSVLIHVLLQIFGINTVMHTTYSNLDSCPKSLNP